MKELPVIRAGIVEAYALIDDKHYDYLKQFSWFFSSDDYVTTKFDGRNVYMHDEVKLCLPRCDHKDGNKLNNQEENLRSATASDNNRNRGKGKNNTSGYKGVSLNKRTGKYQARIMAGEKNVYLGQFDTPELAAAAYDSKVKQLHGDFAVLSLPS